jgi:hypothetical protein
VHGTGNEGVHFRANSADNTLQWSEVSDTGNASPEFGEGVYIGSAITHWEMFTGSASTPDRSDRNIVKNKQKVRIRGWLMMDPEHPDQVGKTRGTIWEIHPIMQVETQQGGRWVSLDNGTTGVHSGATTGQTLPTILPDGTATTPAINVTGHQNNTVVKITNVFYDGKKGSTEPDEYVEITNTGSQPADITDWVLQNASDSDEFKWDNEVLQPGQVIDVYTNEVHPQSGGFSFGSSRAVWANSGGVAELYDSDKVLVSRYPYGNQK